MEKRFASDQERKALCTISKKFYNDSKNSRWQTVQTRLCYNDKDWYNFFFSKVFATRKEKKKAKNATKKFVKKTGIEKLWRRRGKEEKKNQVDSPQNLEMVHARASFGVCVDCIWLKY